MNHHNHRESSIEYQESSIENRESSYLCAYKALYLRAYKALYLRAYKALHLSRTLYKSTLFMQNKPNVKDAQININSYMKSKYEKLDTWLSGNNKPNSNPIKANLVRRRRIAK